MGSAQSGRTVLWVSLIVGRAIGRPVGCIVPLYKSAPESTKCGSMGCRSRIIGRFCARNRCGDWVIARRSIWRRTKRRVGRRSNMVVAACVIRGFAHDCCRWAKLGMSGGGRALPVIFPGLAAQKAAYRFLSNAKVSGQDIFEPQQAALVARCQSQSHILAIQDTTILTDGGHKPADGLVDIGGGGSESWGLVAQMTVAFRLAGCRWECCNWTRIFARLRRLMHGTIVRASVG